VLHVNAMQAFFALPVFSHWSLTRFACGMYRPPQMHRDDHMPDVPAPEQPEAQKLAAAAATENIHARLRHLCDSGGRGCSEWLQHLEQLTEEERCSFDAAMASVGESIILSALRSMPQ
jgi:hypothetical protein